MYLSDSDPTIQFSNLQKYVAISGPRDFSYEIFFGLLQFGDRTTYYENQHDHNDDGCYNKIGEHIASFNGSLNLIYLIGTLLISFPGLK